MGENAGVLRLCHLSILGWFAPCCVLSALSAGSAQAVCGDWLEEHPSPGAMQPIRRNDPVQSLPTKQSHCTGPTCGQSPLLPAPKPAANHSGSEKPGLTAATLSMDIDRQTAGHDHPDDQLCLVTGADLTPLRPPRG
jgi:hypothetical protein